MENYDKEFGQVVKEGDIFVFGFNFGCGSLCEQVVIVILVKKILFVVLGSFGNIFSRNSINNVLMGVEVLRLVQRLREIFKVDGEGNKVFIWRMGWKLVWDVRRSKVIVIEGEGGQQWSQKVGEFLLNVQEIIVRGGLEKWVKSQIEV